MSSASQKALIISSKGAPLSLGIRAIPKLGPGQVLVKIYSAALNPVDNYIQHFTDSYPVVPGQDGAGTVKELGKDATGIQIGNQVLFQSVLVPESGTLQQYALADAVRVAKIPSKYLFDDVVMLPVSFATVAISLYGMPGVHRGMGLPTPCSDASRDKYKGHPALVIGGSSLVGQFAMQLLKLFGFGPIITTALSCNMEYAKAAVVKIMSVPVVLVYDAISSLESHGKITEDGKLLTHVYGSSNPPTIMRLELISMLN